VGGGGGGGSLYMKILKGSDKRVGSAPNISRERKKNGEEGKNKFWFVVQSKKGERTLSQKQKKNHTRVLWLKGGQEKKPKTQPSLFYKKRGSYEIPGGLSNFGWKTKTTINIWYDTRAMEEERDGGQGRDGDMRRKNNGSSGEDQRRKEGRINEDLSRTTGGSAQGTEEANFSLVCERKGKRGGCQK